MSIFDLIYAYILYILHPNVKKLLLKNVGETGAHCSSFGTNSICAKLLTIYCTQVVPMLNMIHLICKQQQDMVLFSLEQIVNCVLKVVLKRINVPQVGVHCACTWGTLCILHQGHRVHLHSTGTYISSLGNSCTLCQSI